MKYQIYADMAEKEGLPNIARLFKAMVKLFKIEEMHPAHEVVAELLEEKGAVRSTHYELEVEKSHAVMFTDANKTVMDKQDIEIGTIQICDIWGILVMVIHLKNVRFAVLQNLSFSI